MIVRLDHIAVAVPDLQAAIRRFSEDLGISVTDTEDVPTESTSRPSSPSKARASSSCTP